MRKQLSQANANAHTQQSSQTGQQGSLSQKLPEYPALFGPNRLFQTNFSGAFGHRDQHNIHNANASYQQGDAGNPHQLLVGGVAQILQLLGLLQGVLCLIDNGSVGVIGVQ